MTTHEPQHGHDCNSYRTRTWIVRYDVASLGCRMPAPDIAGLRTSRPPKLQRYGATLYHKATYNGGDEESVHYCVRSGAITI
jgi:hypothetical protein